MQSLEISDSLASSSCFVQRLFVSLGLEEGSIVHYRRVNPPCKTSILLLKFPFLHNSIKSCLNNKQPKVTVNFTLNSILYIFHICPYHLNCLRSFSIILCSDWLVNLQRGKEEFHKWHRQTNTQTQINHC